MEENIQGKYFSINDRKDISTVIYQVNKTEKEFLKTSPKYTVERLDYIEEIVGEKKRKTFFVDNPAPDGNPLVILSFAKEKVVINNGLLIKNQFQYLLKLCIVKKKWNIKIFYIHQI